MTTVYLAGPMTGLQLHQASEWRKNAKFLLTRGNDDFEVLDPTRGLGAILKPTDRIGWDQSPAMVAEHPELQPAYFIQRCYEDVAECDLVLANLLTEPCGVGTFFELAWACQLGRKIFAIRDSEYRNKSPLAFSPWVSQFLTAEGEELEDVCRAIRGWS